MNIGDSGGPPSSDQPASRLQTDRQSDASPTLPDHGQMCRQVFDLMPGSVVLMDACGYVLDANPAFCKQIGFPREALIGAHVSRFTRETVETINRNIARMMDGEVLAHQVTNVQADGSLRHYDLREAAVTLPNGSRAILALANDITDRLQAVQQRFELERQLLHADKLKSLGVLAGGIAHEYNNFLATIVGNLDLAVMDLPPTSPALTNIREAAEAALRAGNLTQQMLAYSGRGRFVIARIDLSLLISNMEELLRASISKKASVKMHLATELPLIDGDETQLQQVVINLITNASEALGDRPGLIDITTRLRHISQVARTADEVNPPTGLCVELEVSDSGCGMDEATQKRLFEPFFSTKFSGRGLGMAVVQGVVRGHKGALSVTSQPGHGTTVTALFPVSAEKSPATAPAQPLEGKPLPSAEPLQGTVLIAEDELTIRLLMKRILNRLGLKVIAAENGVEAVALFREHAPELDLVILDVTMPKLDGFKTLEAMREIQPEVRAILTSGYDIQDTAASQSRGNVIAFIRKPFQVEALVRAVRQVLRP